MQRACRGCTGAIDKDGADSSSPSSSFFSFSSIAGNVVHHSLVSNLTHPACCCSCAAPPGRLLWHTTARLHDPKTSAAVISCTFSVLEVVIQLLTPPVQSCTMIFDLGGYGFKNYDLNWCYEVSHRGGA